MALETILVTYDDPYAVLAETDLYVTVEPCIMCAAALRQYGIRAVYFGCANDKFGGTGGVFNIHAEYVHFEDHTLTNTSLPIQYSPALDRPYPVFGGIFREEAIMLLRRFYVQENEKGIPATSSLFQASLTDCCSTRTIEEEESRAQDGNYAYGYCSECGTMTEIGRKYCRF